MFLSQGPNFEVIHFRYTTYSLEGCHEPVRSEGGLIIGPGREEESGMLKLTIDTGFEIEPFVFLPRFSRVFESNRVALYNSEYAMPNQSRWYSEQMESLWSRKRGSRNIGCMLCQSFSSFSYPGQTSLRQTLRRKHN